MLHAIGFPPFANDAKMGHPLCLGVLGTTPWYLRSSAMRCLRCMAGFCWHRWVLGSGPGVAHAVDYGYGAQDCYYPQYRGHAVEEGADNYQDEALGALHEADAA